MSMNRFLWNAAIVGGFAASTGAHAGSMTFDGLPLASLNPTDVPTDITSISSQIEDLGNPGVFTNGTPTVFEVPGESGNHGLTTASSQFYGSFLVNFANPLSAFSLDAWVGTDNDGPIHDDVFLYAYDQSNALLASDSFSSTGAWDTLSVVANGIASIVVGQVQANGFAGNGYLIDNFSWTVRQTQDPGNGDPGNGDPGDPTIIPTPAALAPGLAMLGVLGLGRRRR